MHRIIRLSLERLQETVDFETETLINSAPDNLGAIRHSIGYINGLQRAIDILSEVSGEQEE